MPAHPILLDVITRTILGEEYKSNVYLSFVKRQLSGALLEGMTTTDGVLKQRVIKNFTRRAQQFIAHYGLHLKRQSSKRKVWILDCSLDSHRLSGATGTTEHTDSSSTHRTHFTTRFSKMNNKMTNFKINGRHDIRYRVETCLYCQFHHSGVIDT